MTNDQLDENQNAAIPSSGLAKTPSSDTAPSGRELNAAVAERVMGWTRIARESRKGYDAYNDGSGDGPRWVGGFPEPEPYECDHPEYALFAPSTDIAAAMQVVEKMRADGWSFACTMYEGLLPYASFCKRTVASSRNAEAATLPEAICRAALATVAST